jgi:hypothetical protein
MENEVKSDVSQIELQFEKLEINLNADNIADVFGITEEEADALNISMKKNAEELYPGATRRSAAQHINVILSSDTSLKAKFVAMYTMGIKDAEMQNPMAQLIQAMSGRQRDEKEETSETEKS